MILIQFIIVKKHNVTENFEYLNRQIKDPIVPIIPLSIKLFDSKGLANPKTKKCEWNKFLASDVRTIIESFIMPTLFGSSFKLPIGISFQGIVILSIKDNLHSSGHKKRFKKYKINNEIIRYVKNFTLFLLWIKVIANSKGNTFIKPYIAIEIELSKRAPFL